MKKDSSMNDARLAKKHSLCTKSIETTGIQKGIRVFRCLAKFKRNLLGNIIPYRPLILFGLENCLNSVSYQP
jgi:hypothetical protein